MPIGRLKQTDPENRAEIVIYRESSFNAGGVSLAVGIDGQAFATLGNSDYAAMFVRPGTYNFFVRARTAEPTTLKLEAKAGERRCLKTVADSTNVAKILIPIVLMASGYNFTLEEVKCQSESELAKLTRINVEYQGDSLRNPAADVHPSINTN